MKMRREAGDSWNDLGLVFCTRQGSALDAANVRRSFRLVANAAGLNPKEWTPRELRHSFVSLLSSSGVTIEEIAHLVGHGSTSVTGGVTEGTESGPPRALAVNELFGATQAIGRHSLADRSTDLSANARPRSQTRRSLGVLLVGDTGFEPVTSSVSGQNLCLGMRGSGGPERAQGRRCLPPRGSVGRQFGRQPGNQGFDGPESAVPKDRPERIRQFTRSTKKY